MGDVTVKPCPFCGGEAELWRASGERTAWIACVGRCSVLVSKEHKTDAEAIAAWNRRASPSGFNDGVRAAAEAVRRLGLEYEREGSPTARSVLEVGVERVVHLLRP